eukprot:9992585-Heterocapsa_arctica.AAC.1
MMTGKLGLMQECIAPLQDLTESIKYQASQDAYPTSLSIARPSSPTTRTSDTSEDSPAKEYEPGEGLIKELATD